MQYYPVFIIFFPFQNEQK